jgi:hypothetical protein
MRFGATVVVGAARRRGPGRLAGHVIEMREIAYDPDPLDREAEAVRLTAACSAAPKEERTEYPECTKGRTPECTGASAARVADGPATAARTTRAAPRA